MDASVVKADASRQRHDEDDDDWGNGPGVREYLDGLEEDGPVSVAMPKKNSPSDPQARWTAAPITPRFQGRQRSIPPARGEIISEILPEDSLCRSDYSSHRLTCNLFV